MLLVFCRSGSPSVSLGTAIPVASGAAELNYRVDTRLPLAVARMMPGSGVYRVLDTDYDTYAILWSCSNLRIMHAGKAFNISSLLKYYTYSFIAQDVVTFFVNFTSYNN
jgi:apolipoprotein D and lipocalin family protein